MSKILKGVKNLLFVLLISFSPGCAGEVYIEPARNIIIFIGDGMGPEHVKATSIYLTGSIGALSFESFANKTEVTTYFANSSITDSAAAATAIATGVKVANRVISLRRPGHNAELVTMLEYFKAKGKATGLVTTSYMTDATPAAFGAHEPDRDKHDDIASDYFTQTQPNVLFGGGGNGVSRDIAESQGYTVVENNADLMSLDTTSETMVSGQFGNMYLPYEYDIKDKKDSNLPHLSDMTQVALDILDNDPDGFFLMVEGARIDHASEGESIAIEDRLPYMIAETIEFDKSVQKAVNWANGRTDTLIIVTADHETGGLIVKGNNGKEKLPSVAWSSTRHTDAKVPAYAWGKGAEQITGVMDNTDFFDIVKRKSEE